MEGSGISATSLSFHSDLILKILRTLCEVNTNLAIHVFKLVEQALPVRPISNKEQWDVSQMLALDHLEKLEYFHTVPLPPGAKMAAAE